MRKHTRILAAAMTIVEAIVIISLTGCSGKKIDYGNESESKETKNMSALADIRADSGWNENFTIQTGNGEKTVYVNANIVVPDFDNMSVVEVKNIKVGADFKKSVIEAYFGYSTVYYHDIPHYTKEEIYHSMEVVKNEIAGYQQEIDAGLITEEGVSRVMKSENDLLEQYEKAEPSALDTREKATDYTDCNEYLGYIGNVFCELRFGIAEDGSLEYISAQPLKAGSEGTLYDDSEYGYYGPPSFAEEKGVEGFNGGSTGGDTTSSYDNECALSKDEAIKKAEEFQNKLGMASQVYIGTSDYEWSAGVIEDGDDTVKTDDKESVIKDTAWGYIIDYGEGVDGIAFCKSLDFTRNMDIWETPDNYDDFMPYGSSSFIVTDQGVTEFTVSYPVDIVNESKNVELLSMDTIKEIIKDDMTKNSDQYDFTQNHTYNNLKLGYIRLKDASDKDKCTYVPAWCLSKQDKGYDRYPVYVNAIDGTIIRSDDLI